MSNTKQKKKKKEKKEKGVKSGVESPKGRSN